MFYMLFVFIYARLCSKQFPFQMTFVSFNSNTTDITSGAGTAHPSGAHEFTHRFLASFELLNL
jgi:hypothetical protein